MESESWPKAPAHAATLKFHGLDPKPAQQLCAAIWATAHWLSLFHLVNPLLPEISPPALKTRILHKS